jgi:hypothetical protein
MEAGPFAYAKFARSADSRGATLAAAHTSAHDESELVIVRRHEQASPRGRNIRKSNGVESGVGARGRRADVTGGERARDRKWYMTSTDRGGGMGRRRRAR